MEECSALNFILTNKTQLAGWNILQNKRIQNFHAYVVANSFIQMPNCPVNGLGSHH